jgi:hypothetical protein
MCKIFICISENIDFANFIATSLLSLLLIIATIIISWRQNRLQKNINNQQSQLQRNITERETKISLYQYRMNCYNRVMDALDIVSYGKLEDWVVSFQTNGLDFVNKLSDGREMIRKAHIESETLFDDERIATYIGGLYDKYSTLYVKSCDMLMVSDEEYKKRHILVKQKLGITQKDSNENFFIKLATFLRTNEGMDFTKGIIPEYGDCLTLSEELKETFKSNNELFKLMGKYINVKELNKI